MSARFRPGEVVVFGDRFPAQQKGVHMLNFIKNLYDRFNVTYAALFCAVMLVMANGASALDIVTQDGTTGAISFDPSALVDPVLTAIIAAVCAGAAIFLVVVGVRWIKRFAAR